jgi:hypothetical protein
MSRFFCTFVPEMNTLRRILIYITLCAALSVQAQDWQLDDVLNDIFNQLSDDGDMPYEDIDEELRSIAEHPMDLN